MMSSFYSFCIFKLFLAKMHLGECVIIVLTPSEVSNVSAISQQSEQKQVTLRIHNDDVCFALDKHA